jgi:hypothetical protein
MLYLPGLKNVVADFLSRPPKPSSPPESAETVAASAAADPVDFKALDAEQILAQKRSTCLAVHPSN